MKHPHRAAAIVTGAASVLAVSTCVVAGQVAETSAPRSSAAPAPISSIAQADAGPSAEFVVLLYVPTPPTGVLGPEGDPGVLAPEDDTDVLTPDNVIIPSPTLAAPLRAVIRPA